MWRHRLILIISLIYFNEHLIYKLQRFSWSKVTCDQDCTKILLVADPQILGNCHELLIARLDSDAHMRKNFYEVLNFVRPNLVIFLGDIMDEGSIASDRQFLDYYQRFLSIFPISENETGVIYIPGDNDIGGEGFERVEIKNVKRFGAVFGNKTTWSFDNVKIFHVNRIERKMPEKSTATDEKAVRIAIGHYPILHYPDSTSRKAMESLKPNVIFSAHDHHSMLLTYDPNNSFYPNIEKLKAKIDFKFNESVKEIQVPAANYRMGTLTIGYGQAAVTSEGLSYSPLFVVSRFYQFGLYAVSIVAYAIGLLVWKVLRRCCRIRSRGYRQLAKSDEV